MYTSKNPWDAAKENCSVTDLTKLGTTGPFSQPAPHDNPYDVLRPWARTWRQEGTGRA